MWACRPSVFRCLKCPLDLVHQHLPFSLRPNVTRIPYLSFLLLLCHPLLSGYVRCRRLPVPCWLLVIPHPRPGCCRLSLSTQIGSSPLAMLHTSRPCFTHCFHLSAFISLCNSFLAIVCFLVGSVSSFHSLFHPLLLLPVTVGVPAHFRDACIYGKKSDYQAQSKTRVIVNK